MAVLSWVPSRCDLLKVSSCNIFVWYFCCSHEGITHHKPPEGSMCPQTFLQNKFFALPRWLSHHSLSVSLLIPPVNLKGVYHCHSQLTAFSLFIKSPSWPCPDYISYICTCMNKIYQYCCPLTNQCTAKDPQELRGDHFLPLRYTGLYSWYLGSFYCVFCLLWGTL